MPKAIALLSGGLDSTLAVLVVKNLGVDVTAVTFLTHFGCDISDTSSCSKNPFPAAEKFGFKVKLCHLADRFIEIVKNPKFGHGKNMNPCIDCRILMLREAGELMRLTGADFVVTGEVLGQRPMSQRRETFPLIDREAGLVGKVLRPLSAKVLPETDAQKNGLIDRDKLFDFYGRSRKPQMKLAEELGLTEYPNPAGGCLLTEPNYAWRLRELLRSDPDPSIRDLNLLRVGRHFRVGRTKIIAGRNEADNNRIEALAGQEDLLLKAEGCGSPVVLALFDGHGGPLSTAGDKKELDIDPADTEEAMAAASICARYSDNRHLPRVPVTAKAGIRTKTVLAVPASSSFLEEHRVQKPEKKKKENK